MSDLGSFRNSRFGVGPGFEPRRGREGAPPPPLRRQGPPVPPAGPPYVPPEEAPPGGAPPSGQQPAPPPPAPEPPPRPAMPRPGMRVPDGLDDLKVRIHQRLIEDLDLDRLQGLEPERAREVLYNAIRTLLTAEGASVPGVLRDELVKAVADEVLGLGPLEPLLADPSITEIMVNAPDEVFYEREGKLERSTIRFRDAAHVMRIIDRIVSPLGRRVDESSPMVDARLPDGSRVNIVIPPVAPKAPSISIRKFRQDKLKIEDLINVGSMTQELADFISACVKGKLNILISGGTGTGKTTLLNALSAAIPNDERIVTIEDPTELKLQQEHVVSLEARPPSIEGKHEITQRDLVRNALRMRPDRIIVGEVRGSEAFDMLQAMNTGHEGSISTIHANSPRDALARLENMVLMANLDLPVRAIREQVSSALDLIIQVSRHSDGGRRVTHVTEVVGMEGDTITLQDIFLFYQEGVNPEDGKILGQFRPTGIRPTFMEKLERNGIHLPNEVFGAGRWVA